MITLPNVPRIDIDPIKLCCGERRSSHDGIVCPDGKVMCCVCFGRFAPGDLFVDDKGQRWDICAECKRAETRYARV